MVARTEWKVYGKTPHMLVIIIKNEIETRVTVSVDFHEFREVGIHW